MIIDILRLVHEDERRRIDEVNSPEGDFSVQLFTIKKEIPLGNHYHSRKSECFVILEGEGEITTVPLKWFDNMGPSPLESPRTQSVAAGSIIYIEPNTGHRFILRPGSKMLCFSSRAFDPEDKDMTDCTTLLSDPPTDH